MASRTVCFKRFSYICADFFLSGISAVDGSSDAAHQDHFALQTFLKSRDVILRKGSLPYLYTDLGHVLDYRDEVGIRVVDGYDAARADVLVELPVRLLEELAPHVRLHEEGILGSPVIMSEYCIRLQPVDHELDIFHPVLVDVCDQFVHFLRMIIQTGKDLLERHQVVALLKDTRRDESCYELVITGVVSCPGAERLPQSIIAAVGEDIRRMDIVPPVSYILDDLVFLSYMRHGSRCIKGPVGPDAPAVRNGCTRPEARTDICADRVRNYHLEGLILDEPAVRLEKFKENFSCCHHVLSPFFYCTRCHINRAVCTM